MSRAVLLLALVSLSACPPPTGTCAEREFVGVGGDIPSRPILTFDAGEPPLGVQGQPLTVKVFAPRTGCQRDRLSARAELLGPDNFPVTDVTVAEPRFSAGEVVSVEVTFTPDQAGQYLVQLTFEPALGVRSLLLDVGELRTSPPSIRVGVPNLSSCVDSVWPLTADTVACERTSKTIELYSSDGGTTSFQG